MIQHETAVSPDTNRSMQTAVISDVHANLEALDSVLADVGRMDLVCLGDSVGYGANPNEVLKMVCGRASIALLGNHDYAALTGQTGMFNTRAAMGVEWTRKRLDEVSRGYLGTLRSSTPVLLSGIQAFLAHGSPDDPLWEYVTPASHEDLFGHYLSKAGVGAIALGHTHVPFAWKGKEGIIFNPGSVGQPRDGDWRASYAVVEGSPGELRVQHQRVEYDLEKAQKKIRDAGLPEDFAARLSFGR